jgi:glucose/arabinose dehydrogenase
MEPNLQSIRRGPAGSSTRLGALAAMLLTACWLVGPTCQPLLRATLVSSSFDNPIYATTPAGDPRLFVVERAGTVRIFQNGTVLPTPFLDITSQVSTTGEAGLLSIAFSPSYASDGEFYAYYVNTSNTTVLARFLRSSTDPNLADATSQFVLLTQTNTATNHKGGTIKFSPVDGFLYIGLGDGGSVPANARDPSSLLGKMLRIDVTGGPTAPYTIPSTNPFVGVAGTRPEIWDLGFRNPFRWSFDRANGDLWIGDVGQDQREEVDYEPAGQGGRNYGWPSQEGSLCYQPTTDAPCDDPANPTRYVFPVTEYTHADGCAITGGLVSRGAAAFLPGAYLFGDFCSGHIWGFINARQVLLDSQFGGTHAGLTSFFEDADGQVYFTQMTTGRIYRIQ